jgi:flagellin-like protein
MKFTLKPKKRSAVSPVIATLLLIAIAVAAAIIVYAFVTGLIGGLSSGSGSNLYPTTATLVVPTGTSPGTLVITVLNSGNSPVTGIQVALNSGANTGVQDQDALSCMGEVPGGNNCNAATAAVCPSAPAVAVPATFCTAAAAVVDTANPLAVGSQVSASVGVASHGTSILQAGSAYSFTVTIDTASGSSHTELVTATAEL